MLIHTITYEDLDGNPVTEEHHFNLNERELVKKNAQFGEDGLEGAIQKIIDAKDVAAVLDQLDDIVRLSYGVRDGKDFIKDPAVAERFIQSEAYSAMFMELLSDEDKLASFIIGVVPKKVSQNVQTEMNKLMDKPQQEASTLPEPTLPTAAEPKL